MLNRLTYGEEPYRKMGDRARISETSLATAIVIRATQSGTRIIINAEEELMAKVETRNETLVRKFFKTLSTGKLERVRPLFHENATWAVMATGIPGAGEKKGRDPIIDQFLGPVRSLFVDGDPKVKIQRIVCQGPLVAAEARGVGRLKNGKKYDNHYVFMIEVDGDKIKALREYMDSYHVSTLM